MPKQNQHRISQVYLKEFGYKTEGGHWKISTLDKSKFDIMRRSNKLFYSQRSIESVTAEYNIFDLKDEINKNVTIFEDLSGQIESSYPSIISDIDTNSKLSDLSFDLLVQFIPNLLCRVEPFRQLIFSHLDSSNRMCFLKAMCKHQADSGDIFIDKISNLTLSDQLNPVCLVVMDHISNKLKTFNYTILKDFENRGWATSDNPVIIENNLSNNSIFSINTEIYFPLSRNYCLYLSHPNSQNKDNVLRQLDVYYQIDKSEIQDEIYKKTIFNSLELIFFPLELKDSIEL